MSACLFLYSIIRHLRAPAVTRTWLRCFMQLRIIRTESSACSIDRSPRDSSLRVQSRRPYVCVLQVPEPMKQSTFLDRSNCRNQKCVMAAIFLTLPPKICEAGSLCQSQRPQMESMDYPNRCSLAVQIIWCNSRCKLWGCTNSMI